MPARHPPHAEAKFQAAGVSEISLPWFAMDDIDGLEVIATKLVPLVL